jgi:hypothetical protein
MSVIVLTIFVILAGVIVYASSQRLVTSARLVAACFVMAVLASAITMVENREAIFHQWSFSAALRFPFFSDKRAAAIQSPAALDRGPDSLAATEGLNKEDHLFLDEILAKQSRDPQRIQSVDKAGVLEFQNEPALRAELAVNTAKAGLPTPITRRETVKRAELVIHDQTLKRAELVPSRQR